LLSPKRAPTSQSTIALKPRLLNPSAKPSEPPAANASRSKPTYPDPPMSTVVSTAESQLGPIGILVNNAGIGKMLPADQVTEEIWNEFLRVNLTSVFLVTQRVVPRMCAART
jgi:NAD(P)-dependent dehydrogenase (short-subunit alcohol dehydrogenase family)